MPPGTLQGVQLLRSPDYVMLTGLINQTLIDIAADDSGGELDPHGQDLVRFQFGLLADSQHSCSAETLSEVSSTRLSFPMGVALCK